jgi:cytochrome P450
VDDEIGGYFIPGGSIVTVSQWVTHRRPDLWDNPELFDPDRFAPGRADGRHRFAYYPFGGGGRVCIGSALASAEAQVALASLVRRFSFVLAPGSNIEPDPSFTLRPSPGVMMHVSERYCRSRSIRGTLFVLRGWNGSHVNVFPRASL